jgi:hypothetical protein
MTDRRLLTFGEVRKGGWQALHYDTSKEAVWVRTCKAHPQFAEHQVYDRRQRTTRTWYTVDGHHAEYRSLWDAVKAWNRAVAAEGEVAA